MDDEQIIIKYKEDMSFGRAVILYAYNNEGNLLIKQKFCCGRKHPTWFRFTGIKCGKYKNKYEFFSVSKMCSCETTERLYRNVYYEHEFNSLLKVLYENEYEKID